MECLGEFLGVGAWGLFFVWWWTDCLVACPGWQPVHQTVLGIGGVWVVWIMWFDGRLWAISAALDGCKG